MRLIVRSPVRSPSLPPVPAARPRAQRDERRAWIEALFGPHLPRARHQRERAIDILAGDGMVWRLLHQVRHSMTETSATIERLARAAVAEASPLRAA